MKTYRIEVPKPGATNADGSEVRLYEAGETVKAKAGWQKDLMDRFVANGWAIETKMDAPDEVSAPVKAEVKAKPKKKAAPKKAATKKPAAKK